VHDCEEQDTLQVLVTKEPQRSKWDAEVVRNIGHWIGREHDHPEEHDGRSTWVMRRTIRVPDGLPVHASVVVGDVVLRSEQVHVQDQEVTFFLTPAQITSCLGGVRFLVVDEEGRASGAMPALRFFRATSAVGGEFVLRCREFGDASTTSTASGEIRIESLHPGSLGIEVQQPGFAKARLETVVDPGLIRDLGVVRLARDRAIRGHVVNIDGSPASAEVECSALRSTNQGPPPFQPETRETDSPGGFVFYHAAPGIYVLRARGSLQASCATAVVSTESGSVDGIVLRLQPASHVEFRVERPPTSAVVLCIDDSHGQPVRQAGMIVDEKGVYDSADLASGKYTARAISRGDVVATAEFRVSNGALRVRLTPP